MLLLRKLGPLLIGGGLLVALSVSGATAQQATTSLDVAAQLGTVVTATVTLPNWGQPAVTVRLYGSPVPPPAAGVQAAAPAPLRVPLPGTPGPVTADLLKQLAAAPDGQADMIVYLADQADLSAAATIPDWNARGAAVVQTLTEHAARTQQPLVEALQARGNQPRSFWIVNALLVHGDRALAQWLSSQASVGLVGTNAVHALDQPVVAPASAGSVAWGLAKINAPAVWADWNDRGDGIVVANIDTGVDFTHNALLTSYRGWSPQGVTHDYNWYDATKPNGQPCTPSDPVGHGTHTMGTIVGQAAGGYAAIGVAPQARWIAARGCASNFCADDALLASAQWMLAPTDCHLANPRPDLRPHIISNSWGAPGDNQWYAGYVTAWNAAGIFSVFAGGNYGNFTGCQSTVAPGNYASAFSVGATDSGDFITDFSSRGPTSDGRVKPDISAPGLAVPSAWPGGGVATLSGTSMATPHVAGAAALIWSANPLLIGNIAATRQVLTSTVVPRTSAECGDAPGATPNNVYGWGRLDAHAAVMQARTEVPWLSLPATAALPANAVGSFTVSLDARQVNGPGSYQAYILVVRNAAIVPIPVSFLVGQAAPTAQLTGQLVDQWTSAGVYGRVELDNQSAARTDANGYYTLTLPLGFTPLTATATGYLPAPFSLNLVTDTQRVVVLMPDQPHLQLSAPLISATLPFGGSQSYALSLNNAGPEPLSATVSVPPFEWSVTETTPSPGPPPFYDMSAFPRFVLADDQVYTDPLPLGFNVPIYGQLVSQIYLSSNGWVSAAKPSSSVQYADCLPNGNLPAGALAPFWTDLNPAITGTIHAGAVSTDTFVVSFENVPHWSQNPQPTDPTYSFQLALHADGKVEFIYGPMGALPGVWSVGVSHDAARGQNIACYRTTSALAGRRWTAANQTSPPVWLTAAPGSLNIAPGATETVTASLFGFGYVPWRADPFSSVVRLTTNDPLQPVVDVPAEDWVTGPAPYNQWLPFIAR
jgi:subtilisin family serine protease